MARIAGIQIEKDSKGHMTYARINLKKHKDLFPYLEQKGAIEEDEFDKLAKDCITGDELRAEMSKRIATYPERLKKMKAK